MIRTRVYLRVEDLKLLDREAARTGVSRSELVRRAVRHQYGDIAIETRREGLRESAGAWQGRDFTGEEYVDAMRGHPDDRPERLDRR